MRRLPFDRHARCALIVACITLLACSVGFRWAVAALNIYLRKEPVELRDSFAGIPKTIGQWTQLGEDEPFDAVMLEALGTSDTISRAYAINGDPSQGLLSVHVAYYTGMIDAVPHVPERCFVAGGLEPQTLSAVFGLNVRDETWTDDPGPVNRATGQPYHLAQHRHPFTNRLTPVRMPVGDMQLRLTEFARKDKPGVTYCGGYLFIANGRVTATAEDIRLLAFKPSERFAYYCKVQFMYAATGQPRDQFLALVSDFLSDFLPELMLRLPDWQEVERLKSKG